MYGAFNIVSGAPYIDPRGRYIVSVSPYLALDVLYFMSYLKIIQSCSILKVAHTILHLITYLHVLNEQ